MKKKINKYWKTIAIIFIILFTFETIYVVYSVSVYNQGIKNQNICFYDICANYPDAYYDSDNKVCSCYDYDVLGNEQVSFTQYMGRR